MPFCTRLYFRLKPVGPRKQPSTQHSREDPVPCAPVAVGYCFEPICDSKRGRRGRLQYPLHILLCDVSPHNVSIRARSGMHMYALTVFPTHFSIADILVVMDGTAGAGRTAPPTSTRYRMSARLNRVQEHSSRVNVAYTRLRAIYISPRILFGSPPVSRRYGRLSCSSDDITQSNTGSNLLQGYAAIHLSIQAWGETRLSILSIQE